ncbi:unnamed protein product [Mytilus edulis]|uniref:Integrase core domain-containing protein n=1 Tax=Mytilus edulis TaxID=6550 RepID=A0A8S3UIN6_MYTED|nr:unnamed protein product [Mytilus edulis]
MIHIDGYDKIKPYGIAIHGAIDGYSRRILWLKAGCSNNNPRYIAKFYIDFVKELRRVPRAIRADAGTENVLTQLNQFMENWNDHRIRRQRQEVIVPSGIPNVLYFQPEIYDSSDFSFPILCNDQTLSELENEHTSDLPVRGCSEDFMHLIGYLSGEEPMQALIPQTLDEAFQNFCTLIYICNGCRI